MRCAVGPLSAAAKVLHLKASLRDSFARGCLVFHSGVASPQSRTFFLYRGGDLTSCVQVHKAMGCT